MTRASVCLASYNGSLYLREQLDSILCQLGPEDELIISDDNSTDDTQAIIRSYADVRVRVIRNPAKRGHVRNFANAMRHAVGEFIVLSDQDDIWAEGRLQRMLDELKRFPRRSLVVGGLVEFDETGQRIAKKTLGPAPTSSLRQLCHLFLGKAKYYGSAFVFRRELLRYILPIPACVEAHDIWIAMNACLHGGVVHLQEITLFRRLHANNLTPEKKRRLPTILLSRLGYLEGLLMASLR